MFFQRLWGHSVVWAEVIENNKQNKYKCSVDHERGRWERKMYKEVRVGEREAASVEIPVSRLVR